MLFHQLRGNRGNYSAGMDKVQSVARYYNDHREDITIPAYIVDNGLFDFFNKQHTEPNPVNNIHTEVKTAKVFSGKIMLYNRRADIEDSKPFIIKDIKNNMIKPLDWNTIQLANAQR